MSRNPEIDRAYYDELEFIRDRFGGKGWISTAEIAALDLGEAADKKEHAAHLRSTRNRYGIQNGGLTAAQLARKRCQMNR